MRWPIGARSKGARLGRTEAVVVFATLLAVLLVGGASIAILRDSEPEAAAFEDSPEMALAPSTTTLPPTTVTTAPAVRTTPIPPPANPRRADPVVKIGEIRIPKIGLVHPIFEGVTLTVIDQGPGHWPGSAMPGQVGNAVFAGHRVTHTHPFLRINGFVPGDDIIVTTAEGTFTYKMNRFEIVTPKDVHIVDPTPGATMTLFACHPPHSARQRYVVRATFYDAQRV